MKMKRILSVSMLCVMALMVFAQGAASVPMRTKGENPKEELEQNSLVGEWSDAFGRYNCYSYVLGITDFWHSPGDFVGLPRPGILPAQAKTVLSFSQKTGRDSPLAAVSMWRPF